MEREPLARPVPARPQIPADLGPVPERIEAALNQYRVARPLPDLCRADSGALARLRWLCAEMRHRTLEVSDDARFGDIGGLVEEAADLALHIGFPNPPVE